MGKKGWFSAVKKAVSPSCTKFKKNKRSQKSKSNHQKSWHGNHKSFNTCLSQTQATLANPPQNYSSKEDTELKYPENEQIKHVDPVSYTSRAPAEVNCMTLSPCFIGKLREEIGAIKIQAACRGYLARKAVQSMKAQRRLHLWIKGQAVKRQTTSTLTTIQTMARIQSQVRTRKIRMTQVNEALQRQLLQKREKACDKERGFDLSPRSKEHVEARLQNKKDAAERREKALAYAFSRQQAWRHAQKSANSTVVDRNYPDWDWNWSERWNAIRPWQTETTNNNDIFSTPTGRNHKVSLKSVISKPVLSQSGLKKKGSLSTKSGAGLTKKRNLVSNLASSGGKRSLGAPTKYSNTLRWK